ncbi:hypothetical protein CJ430_18640 [Klebsiella pneumoniae]|nr:hypothetical protein CJ430_18640 [Klebsiella pneumoniae]
MFAVVPCQWRRIIGSNSEVTRGNAKKVFNRLFFQQRGEECRKNRRFAVLTDETGRLVAYC